MRNRELLYRVAIRCAVAVSGRDGRGPETRTGRWTLARLDDRRIVHRAIAEMPEADQPQRGRGRSDRARRACGRMCTGWPRRAAHGPCFRQVRVDPSIIELRERSRVDGDLAEDMIRLTNRMREQLHRYYLACSACHRRSANRGCEHCSSSQHRRPPSGLGSSRSRSRSSAPSIATDGLRARRRWTAILRGPPRATAGVRPGIARRQDAAHRVRPVRTRETARTRGTRRGGDVQLSRVRPHLREVTAWAVSDDRHTDPKRMRATRKAINVALKRRRHDPVAIRGDGSAASCAGTSRTSRYRPTARSWPASARKSSVTGVGIRASAGSGIASTGDGG